MPGKPPLSLAEYEKSGGYQAARKALTSMSPKEITEMVKASNLRGRGGAGFPTAQKWSFVPMGADAPQPKYLVVNADEMEPGAFKDRLLLEGDPHQLIEGVMISAFAIESEIAYIFLRKTYTLAARRILTAIAEAYEKGYLGKNIFGSGVNLSLHLHESAGRYICGEETALLNALEGKRAVPRNKPPFPPVVGLWGKPTVTNNVETICNIPHIIANGAAWFRALSRVPDGGTKIYGVSGKVQRPGAWELPLGTTIREIIEEHAGGMKEGLQLRAVLPGGASTDLLTADHLDVKMDFNSMQAADSRLGTGTMVAIDDRTCIVGLVLNIMRFFAQESCGWCTPCREGLPWAAKLLAAIEEGHGLPEDIERLELLTRLLSPGHTFCALAPGAMEPLQSALKYFEDDFHRHIKERRCPWK
ncbi:MAG: NADH-quinone oxidoreductase subunit NuoF [Desulfobacteraceae bacterium]|nr:NADH-quinone oxidoreductase subunit NuoF [Desulfobacteraceae bacterium]